MKKIICLAFVLLFASALSAQTLVTCESKNNVRHTCEADARGRFVSVNQQLSGNACIVGKTWGVNRDRKSIWVDGGCRAEFIVGTNTVANDVLSARHVICSSSNNGKTNCAADTAYGVQLAKQLSKNGCERGKDWGFDQNGIWVDHGCRAEFALGGDTLYTPMTSSARATIKCESQNNTRNRCNADTFYGVTLARQLSNNMCVRGSSWGYDSNGIWVDKGCRAEFAIGY